MNIRIYRPEITTWEPRDREWVDTYHQPHLRYFDPLPNRDKVWVNTRGTFTFTYFYPFKDEDKLAHGSSLRDVSGGSQPAYVISAPGSYVETKGNAMYLYTREGKVLDAINALIAAKRGEFGLSIVTGLAEEPAPPPAPTPEPTPLPRAVPLPARKPRVAVKQLSLFGEEVALV